MTPDKIFARVVAGHLYASRTPIKLFGEEFPEYIRSDALLEWAKDVRETAKDNMDIRLAMEMVMSKIELL